MQRPDTLLSTGTLLLGWAEKEWRRLTLGVLNTICHEPKEKTVELFNFLDVGLLICLVL